jgi:hypothetical protein
MEEQTYRIESKISRILFWISVFITVATMVMMVMEFFSRGKLPATRIGNFYIGVLLIYSFHKEALRWLEEKDQKRVQRRGEIFVYAWLILTTVIYLVNFLNKDFYMTDDTGRQTRALMEITSTALEAGGVFLFTRLIKVIFNTTHDQKK